MPIRFTNTLLLQLSGSSGAVWRAVSPPRLFGVEPPKPRTEAVRIVDMSASNSWAEFAGLFCSTRQAFLDHERSKAELKALMPEDAKEAIGHGVRAKRSKSGVSFDLRKSLWLGPSGLIKLADRSDPSAMRRSRAGSTSCARH